MYHCHVEDVEHVHMGMTGLVFVRPVQDGNTAFYPSGKYAYNDGDGSTGFDREFAMMLTEVWAEAHWATPTSSCRSGATTTPTSPC